MSKCHINPLPDEINLLNLFLANAYFIILYFFFIRLKKIIIPIRIID